MTSDGLFSDATGLWLKKLAGQPVVIALSGGIDSMTLAHGLHAFYQRHMWPLSLIHLVHINHNLRATATPQAHELSTLVRRVLGADLHVLNWEAPLNPDGFPHHRLQAQARQARYGLLAEAAVTTGASVILTAHHADDQIEGFLMRAGMGSGLKGLGGITTERLLDFLPDAPASTHHLTLLRPLLDQRRCTIEAYAHQHSLPWIEDPTNATGTYSRNRWRRLLHEAEHEGLAIQGLPQTMKKLQASEQALIELAQPMITTHLRAQPGGWWEMDYPLWTLSFQAFQVVMNLIRGAFVPDARYGYPLRDKAFRWAHQQLAHHRNATLGGLILAPHDCKLRIYREPQACPTLTLKASEPWSGLWDNRFPVTIIPCPTSTAIISLRAMGEHLWQKYHTHTPPDHPLWQLPGPARWALPSIVSEGHPPLFSVNSQGDALIFDLSQLDA